MKRDATTPEPSRLTPEKIEELLRRGERNERELEDRIERLGTLSASSRDLVLR